MVTAQDLLRKDYVSVDINDTISELIGALNKAKEHDALVFDGKKYLGVVAKRFLLTTRINPSEMKVANIIKKRSKSKTPFFVPILERDTDIKEICRLMATSDSHVLPVLEKDKVIGIVNAIDVVQEITQSYAKITCGEFSNFVITVRPKDGLDTAIDIFSRKDIDHLPVVDEQNRLMGMIAMSDLLENPQFWSVSAQKISQAASHQKGKKTGYQHGEKTSMLHLPVSNSLSRRQICSTSPETKIPDAVKRMVENDVCSIVLIKYDKPVGILTMRAILSDYAK